MLTGDHRAAVSAHEVKREVTVMSRGPRHLAQEIYRRVVSTSRWMIPRQFLPRGETRHVVDILSKVRSTAVTIVVPSRASSICPAVCPSGINLTPPRPCRRNNGENHANMAELQG